ncbi:MAG: transglutaminase family protein [Candidatus Binataceae bacterium]
MRLKTIHTTKFSYDLPAYESHNQLRLKPLNSEFQRVLQFRFSSDPPASVLEYEDGFGNIVHSVSVYPPHDELTIVVESLVERLPEPQKQLPRVRISEYLTDDDARSKEQYDFLHASQYVPFSERLRKFFWSTKPDQREDVTQYVRRTVGYIRDQFHYEKGATSVHSNLDDILTAGCGVCQDFAHLTIGVLRLAGVPARYVSGYLAPEPVQNKKEPVNEQASHAWVEALLPNAGWVGFDPTHRGRVTERHIRVAIGRDYGDVPPLRGVYRSAGKRQSMTVELHINETGEAETSLPDTIQQQQTQQQQ